MKRLLLIVFVLLGTVAAVVGGSILFASERGGEVVTLRTGAPGGSVVETRLWIVDHDGAGWLRAGMASSRWLRRIEAQPEVELLRNGRWQKMLATPVRDPAVRDRIHELMAEKYGLADQWISLLRDGTGSVPVRLTPRLRET